MKTKIRCLLCAMLCVCLGLPTAFAATITPSVTQISLPKGETKASFDVILTVDKDFAGAEFGLKPSADDVTLKSLQMLGQIGGDSPVQADKNGVHYFGFFTGSNAYKPGTYTPDGICTRAQTVTFLWRSQGSPKAAGAENPFTDVSKDAYYYDAVLWAVEQGITNGTSATTFSPDATVTRGQTAAFLWRVAKQPQVDQTANPFADVTQNAYYYNAVLWAVAKEITNGTSSTTFSPDQGCTRAQIVTFLWRTNSN